ncbi:hypothetical protein VTH06DRAFT_3944 [Thermothelomyces fergusii]
MTAGDPPEAIAEWILAQSSGRLTGSSGRPPPPLDLADRRDDEISRGWPDATAANLGPGLAENSQASRRPDPLIANQPRARPGASTQPTKTRKFSLDPVPSVFPPGIYTPPVEPPRRLHFPPPDASPDPLPHTWTKVTSDRGLVRRLLARFFGCSLPHLSIVSQRHFMTDFCQGNPRFCSEALVNAVLGMACVAATPTSQLVSRVSFGDAFLAEAKRLLAKEEGPPGLPYTQALGVLAVAEMARGNEEVASDLARQSARAGIRFLLQTRRQEHDHDDDFKSVRALAYCGGLSLVRLLTGDLEPKTGISLQVQFFAQLQHCPPLARFVFEVTEAAHTFSSYNHSKAMTASDLEGAFGKCVGYHRQVAELSECDADSAGPDVLFAQWKLIVQCHRLLSCCVCPDRIWYNFCLLSLLRPFAADSAGLVDGLPPSLAGQSTPRAVCRRSSAAIISLTGAYQARYSLGCLPPLLPYMVFAAVLHQQSLTAAARLTVGEAARDGVVLSPGPQSPGGGVPSPSSSLSDRRRSMYRPGASLGMAATPATCGGEPPSPPVVAAMKTPGSAGHEASAFPTPSTCLSTQNQGCRSGTYPVGSYGLSFDAGQRSPPERSSGPSDALPVFTSEPADLVALGSLQLVAMGAQHRGAAEASRLLRTPGSAPDRYQQMHDTSGQPSQQEH